MILVPDLKDIEASARSDAERRVARLLHGVDGDPEAVAFHSVMLRSHAYKQQAEADFVIIWKGVVILVEVKGGGVRKHEGAWYSIDRRKDWHKLNGSPMEQARSASYALRDILHEDGGGWYAQESIVITPDIDTPARSVEWHSSHWLAKDDMSIVDLQHALDAVIASARTAPNGKKVARASDLRARLFGEFTRLPVIDAQRGAVLEEQNRATAGQARVLAALARNRRMLVFGGAGTGKSLILAEAAKQDADQGLSVLITFRSPGLLPFFHTLVADRKIDVIPFDDLPADKTYEAVFVDEAQDMMSAEDMDRLDTVINDGRAAGRWRMFLDPNNQARVDGSFDGEVLSLISDEATSVDLHMNVRNTRAIVHVVQEYLGADVGDPGIVHGERVNWHSSESESNHDDAVALAEQLVADGVRRSELWIISTTSTDSPQTEGRGITVTSPKHAKGLEAEHVIVCDLPETFDEAGCAAFYVAATRARVTLHIIATKDGKRLLQLLIKQRLVKK